MRKFLVLGVLAFSLMIFAAFGPRDGGFYGGFERLGGPLSSLEFIYRALPKVEDEGSLTEVGFMAGRFFLKVEAKKDSYYVFVPLVLIRDFNISFKLGDTLMFEGRVIETVKGKVVVPEVLQISGKRINLKEALKGVLNRWMERKERMGRFMRGRGRREPIGWRRKMGF